MRIGNWRISPSLLAEYQYNDNVLATRAQIAERDFIVTTAPGVDLLYKPGRDIDLRAGYRFGWNDYLDDNAIDYLTHDANMQLTWRHAGLRGLTITLADVYSQTGSTDVFQDEFQSFTRLQGNNLSTTFTYVRTRFGAVAKYQHGITDYLSRSDEIQDYQTHDGSLLVFYRLTDRGFQVYGRTDFQRVLFRRLDKFHFDTYTFIGGVRGYWKRIFFDFRVGNRRRLLRLSDDSDDGCIIALDVAYKPVDRVELKLGGERTFNARPSVPTSKDTRFYLNAEGIVRRNLTLNLQGEWLLEKRANGLDQESWSGALRGEYRVTRFGWVHAEFERRERTNNRLPSETINTITVGGRLKF